MSVFLRPVLLAAGLGLTPLSFAQSVPDPSAPSLKAAPAPAPSGTAPNSSLTSTTDAARAKIADAVKHMNATPADPDGAIADLTQALQLKPDSGFAYVLRASIYSQRKQFPQAQADFESAQRLDPKNVVIKYNLAELKMMQKQFDPARAGFLPLQGDADMGDFATYKVFLCDLFGGHEDLAKAEYDAFNKKGEGPGYYFANAAWDLYHKNDDDARIWLTSAFNIFPLKKCTTYGDSLRYLGYLPLPPPKDLNATK